MRKIDKNKKFRKSPLNKLTTSKQAVSNKTILPNGIRLITEEVHYVESFALGICINAGSREDPINLPGLAHFTEHAVLKRTKKRNARQIADELESFGAYFNAFTTKESTCIYIRALKKHFTRSMELLSDIVLNPVFTERDMKNERQVVLEEIKVVDDDPEELIFDFCDKLIFGNHTLSNPILGTKNTVQLITIEDIERFHRKFYTSQNIIVSMAGKINHESALKLTERYFGTIASCNEKHISTYPNETFVLRQEISKKYQQSHIIIGRRIPGADSEERYPIALLNILFGDGMSSRLNQQLRERLGLAYNVYSATEFFSDCGAMYIYAATDKSKIGKLEKTIIEETYKLIVQRIGRKEIDRAKELLKTSAVMELESMSSRMQILAKNEFYHKHQENIHTFISKIDAVTYKDVKNIANDYFNIKDWNCVIFHPDGNE
jgi:predicted Zn-dependent peptidase